LRLDLITAIILGAIQGATEFLPVSSSGHLVLAEKILGGTASAGLIFEVIVHFATMVSVLIYFRNKIGKLLISLLPPYTEDKLPSLKLAVIIVIGTIPAVIIGLAFEDYIEIAFGSATMVSVMLIATACLLLSTRLVKPGKKQVGFKSGLIIGIAQAAAIMPGISRSGTTITAGLHLKIAPAEAAEFSFLLSLPAVFGAGVLKSFSLMSSPLESAQLGAYAAGAAAAFVIGYLSIAWLMSLIKKGQFFYFGLYCLLIGVSGLVFL